MVWKKWIFVILFLGAFGISQAGAQQNCYFLGSNPSLIVKFKNFPSSHYKSKTIVKNLQASTAAFSSAKPMSGDAFIVFFQPVKTFNAQTYPGCFDKNYLENLIQELKFKNDVEYAEPNLLMRLAEQHVYQLPPVINPIQWNLLAPPGGIDARNAFSITLGSNKVITAILDTGILRNNSLTPNLLPGVTFNDNGEFKIGASPSCNAACIGYDHGTHVAGIVAASGRLAYGERIFGVAPQSQFLPINVFTKTSNPVDCLGTRTPCLVNNLSDLINAINWLNNYKFNGLPPAPYITMTNLSLEEDGQCPVLLQEAINQLLQKNIGFAVAAGNGHVNVMNVFPANCRGVMPVAATSQFGFGTSYSNFGKIIPFAAPGGDFPQGLPIESTIADGYGFQQGTSMAAPHVAGLAALLYTLDPTLTPIVLLNLIKNTTTPFPPGGPGFSCTPARPCGSGIINAYQAVLATRNQAPRLVWNSNVRININTRTQATIQWQPALWQPARNTPIIYTVNLNGMDVPNCTNIKNTSCIITNANPKIVNKLFIRATDIRQIYNPVRTSILDFTMFVFKGPILNVAERNPLNGTQAFIYFSSLGNATADGFTINGIPGAVLSLDTGRSRFVVNGITIPKVITNVSITATFGVFSSKSNSITIPSIL